MPQMFIESVIALRIYCIGSAIFFASLARNYGGTIAREIGPKRSQMLSWAHTLGGVLPCLYWLVTRGTNIRSSRGVTIRPKLVQFLRILVITLVGALFGELIVTTSNIYTTIYIYVFNIEKYHDDMHPPPREFHKRFAWETVLLIGHALFLIRILTHDDPPSRKRKQKRAKTK